MPIQGGFRMLAWPCSTGWTELDSRLLDPAGEASEGDGHEGGCEGRGGRKKPPLPANSRGRDRSGPSGGFIGARYGLPCTTWFQSGTASLPTTCRREITPRQTDNAPVNHPNDWIPET